MMKISNMKTLLILSVLATVDSTFDGLQCPKIKDLKHHSIVVTCKTPNGNESSCSSAMPVGTNVKYGCDRSKDFRFRRTHSTEKFRVQCNTNSMWTNYEHLQELQCVQDCGLISTDSPPQWELYIKKKKLPQKKECMGTLIPALSSKSLSFIVTSRKCVCEPNNGPPVSRDDLVVTLPNRPYSQTREFQVKDIYLPNSKEDIALVRLNETLEINPSLKPICLPFDLTPQGPESPIRRPHTKLGKISGFGESTNANVTQCTYFDYLVETDSDYCAERISQEIEDCDPIEGPFVTEEPSVYGDNQTVSTLRGVYSSYLTRDDCNSGFLFTGITPPIIDWIRRTVHSAEGSKEHIYHERQTTRRPVAPTGRPTHSPSDHYGQQTSTRPWTSTLDYYIPRQTPPNSDYYVSSWYGTPSTTTSTNAYQQQPQAERNRYTLTPPQQERSSTRRTTSTTRSVDQTRQPTATTPGKIRDIYQN